MFCLEEIDIRPQRHRSVSQPFSVAEPLPAPPLTLPSFNRKANRHD